MHGNSTIVRFALTLLIGSLVTSCAYAPRVPEESNAVLSIRSDYIRTHPDGPYNAYIQRGEVVKGMQYLEVLASWGHPRSRLRVPSRRLEYWRYLTHDDVSGDWMQYTFVFENDVLLEWQMARHTSLGRAMAQIEFDDPTEEGVLDAESLRDATRLPVASGR